MKMYVLRVKGQLIGKRQRNLRIVEGCRVAILSRPFGSNPKFVGVFLGPWTVQKGGLVLAVGDWSPKSTAMFSRPGPSCLEGPDVIYASYSKARRREAS